MNASDWGRTQDQWMNILYSVTEIRVITEAIVGYEIVGFDNFKLQSSPVSEPATVIILGSGLVGLLGCRRKFKK